MFSSLLAAKIDRSMATWTVNSSIRMNLRKMNILGPSPLSLSRRWTVDGQRIFFFCTSRILFRWITHSERRSQTQLNHHEINTNEQQQKIWYRSHTFDGTESGRRVRVARFLSIEVITLHRTYQITLTVCSFGILVSVVRVPSVCA